MFMPISYTYVVWDWCMDFNPPLTLTLTLTLILTQESIRRNRPADYVIFPSSEEP